MFYEADLAMHFLFVFVTQLFVYERYLIEIN